MGSEKDDPPMPGRNELLFLPAYKKIEDAKI